MVLAYNMLTAADSATAADTPAEGIKRSIMKRLNVNGETQRGKYYGSESKYLEFKTSLVYVPRARKCARILPSRLITSSPASWASSTPTAAAYAWA